MTPESWQRLGVLFSAASELRQADRRAFLERECAGDIDLLAHVLELLDHDHKSDRDGSLDGGSRRSGPYWMEYLSGPTLERFIARYGPMASGRAIELLRQLCKALQKAHEVGLIHRDLKPGNVIVTCQDGQRDLAKLLDFGLVRDLGEAGFDGRLTEVGQIMGTPAYMSPEQASGGSILDARSDIYILACVGYFALTGRPVFDGDSMGQLIAAHLTKDPPDLTGIRSDVPHDLAAVVHRCLAKNPADRFTDVSALERTLGHCECAVDWSPEASAAWWRTTIEAGETPEQSQPASTASFSSGPQ